MALLAAVGTASNTAAWLAFTGALVVAAIAAATAHVRQLQELRHSERRDERRLEEEARREAVRLTHERGLHDLAELRERADAIAVVVWRLIEEFHELQGAWGRFVGVDPNYRKVRESEAEDQRIKLWTMTDGELKPEINRLVLRVGLEHPFVNAAWAMNEVFFEAASRIGDSAVAVQDDDGDYEKFRPVSTSCDAEVMAAWEALMREGVALVGSSRHPSSGTVAEGAEAGLSTREAAPESAASRSPRST